MSSDVPVREGDLLAGKYRVERVLGAGGMGVVVAARHEELDQRVAIKFVRDEALGNEGAVERFLREARAAVKLRSEHAAKVLDVGKLASGAPYMVMEYLEGSDLGAVLTERGPLPVESAAEWIVQACEAVAEAHGAGIVHRDLKPQNLFLARSVGGATRMKVLDFGVAKSLSNSANAGQLTQTRAMLGSPLYMSPEQMRSSRDVDARADVWALGVVLFELLTCRWPFEAESMPELCLKVVSDPPMALRSLRPDVPQALVDVVETCLRKEPSERYANAAELASALEAFAPPASQIIAARARLAVGGSARPPAPSLPNKTLASPEVSARTGPTDAAWGSSQASNGKPRSRVGLIAGVAAGAVGLVALGFFASRHAPEVAPAPAQPVAAAPAPPSTAIAATATAAAAASIAPAAATSQPAAEASTPASATTATPAPPAAAGAAGAPGPKAHPGPAAGPKPPGAKKPADDDIPSLR